jgi:hypothetical protein
MVVIVLAQEAKKEKSVFELHTTSMVKRPWRLRQNAMKKALCFDTLQTLVTTAICSIRNVRLEADPLRAMRN